MSLVERAIRKLQQSAALAEPTLSPPAGPGGPAEREPSSTAPHGGRASRHASTLVLDRAALRSAGLLPPEAEERQLAEQYRRIKRPLIASAFGRGVPAVPNGHLIVVTSAMAGEGKTFTSVNLALSLALEMDVHTLLVDADVAKPQISRLLGISNDPGLLDALRDPEVDVESLVQATDVGNLQVLPAGTASREATELLASQRMQQVTAALGAHDRQRIVLLDSSPLLQTSESHALTEAAGQILVVVRAEATPQPVLLDALKLLEGRGAVSLVLNQTRKSGTAYYYYGYGDERAN